MNTMIKTKLVALSMLVALLTSCTKENDQEPISQISCGDSDDLVTYEFIFIRDADTLFFSAATSDKNVMLKANQELNKPLDERTMHINGLLSSGVCDYNQNYSWHFIHDKWDLVEASIEWCDAFPGNPDSTGVDRVCPWSSRVYKKLTN